MTCFWLGVGAKNTSGVSSVWTRDLVLGAWNFHDFHQTGKFREIGQHL
jgi:hypothetical protein